MTDLPIQHADAMSALEAILASGAIGERSRLRLILRYVVEEELAGRGAALKAYSIGVDVLGRGEDFDPSLDSVVRVEVNRLRQRLEAYYAGAGAADPIKIALPRGAYRPEFQRGAPAVGGSMDAQPPEPVKPPDVDGLTRRRLLFVSLGLLAAVCVGVAAWLFGASDNDAALQSGRDAPILEVGAFTNQLTHPDFQFLGAGFRAHLASDLARYSTLRVRLQATGVRDAALPPLAPASYSLTGHLTRPGDMIRLHLILVDTASNELIWSTNQTFPQTYSGMHETYIEKIHSIAAELGSASGALAADAMRRAEKLPPEAENMSAYLCLLRWHAFDLDKKPEDGARAKKCLATQTAAGVESGPIWAASAFMKFLSWTRLPLESRDRAMLQSAMQDVETAIRLDPTGAAGHRYRGSILSALGQFEEAEASFGEALEHNRSDPEVSVLFGWAAIQQGDWENGIAHVQRGLELSPAPPSWYRIPLSMNAFRTNDYEKALAQAEIIARSGDLRGAPLALAAALQLKNTAAVDEYAAEVGDAIDPFGPIEAVVEAPELLERYRKTVRDWRNS